VAIFLGSGAASFGRAGEEEGRFAIQVRGLERHYLLHPGSRSADPGPRPAVIVFHGFTQSARSAEELFDFSQVWPEAIAVYPEGLDRTVERLGGARGPGWQFAAGEFDDRDVAFFDALRARLVERHGADPDRLFVFGYSNGAYFANLLGCLRPDAVAGLAAVAGGIPCRPKHPVPAILSHGIQDRLVPFGDGQRAADTWAEANGAGEALPEADGCSLRRGSASAVVFCTHPGGHEYDRSFTARAAEFFRSIPRGRPSH
jgi:polyhydroxybutyrate depolymerase